jgi:hypothetical protein
MTQTQTKKIDLNIGGMTCINCATQSKNNSANWTA